MNRLIIIGWMGVKTAYLNISRTEAIARYMASHEDADPPTDSMITEFTFTDTFGVYDAWASD